MTTDDDQEDWVDLALLVLLVGIALDASGVATAVWQTLSP